MGKNETVGHGYVINGDRLEEREARTMRLVLRRDNSLNNGFYLETAYPNVLAPDAEPTGRELGKKDVIEGRLYNFPSPLAQAAFMHMGAEEGRVTHGTDRNHSEYVRISSGGASVYVTETMAKARAKGVDGAMHTVPFSSLKKDAPALHALAVEFIATFRDVRRQWEAEKDRSLDVSMKDPGALADRARLAVKAAGERLANVGSCLPEVPGHVPRQERER